MPTKKYVIALNADERDELRQISLSNRRSAREKRRARLLLGSDQNTPCAEGGRQSDAALAQLYKVSQVTVSTVRQDACERGALGCIERQEQPQRKARALDGAGEAHLVALTCSAPPEGTSRWTLKLLRERHERSDRLAEQEKPHCHPRQLALHHQRRQNQTAQTLSQLATRLDH